MNLEQNAYRRRGRLRILIPILHLSGHRCELRHAVVAAAKRTLVCLQALTVRSFLDASLPSRVARCPLRPEAGMKI